MRSPALPIALAVCVLALLWVGGYASNDILAVVFFGAAAGAAFEVVVEVGRFIARRAPGGLGSAHVLGGFLAGVAGMYVTGLIAA